MYVVDSLNVQHSDKPPFTKRSYYIHDDDIVDENENSTLWNACARDQTWDSCCGVVIMTCLHHYTLGNAVTLTLSSFCLHETTESRSLLCVIHERWLPMHLFPVGGGRKTNKQWKFVIMSWVWCNYFPSQKYHSNMHKPYLHCSSEHENNGLVVGGVQFSWVGLGWVGDSCIM